MGSCFGEIDVLFCVCCHGCDGAYEELKGEFVYFKVKEDGCSRAEVSDL